MTEYGLSPEAKTNRVGHTWGNALVAQDIHTQKGISVPTES